MTQADSDRPGPRSIKIGFIRNPHFCHRLAFSRKIVKHDVFQEKMSDLMSDPLYVRANCFTNRSLTDPQILEKAVMKSKSAGYKLVPESCSWQKQP